MRLRLKILSGFLILALMLLIAGAWSVYQMNDVGLSVQKLLNDNYYSINEANKMIEALEREDSAVLLLLLGKWEQGRAIVTAADAQFAEAFRAAKNRLTIPGEGAYLDSIDSAYQIYKKLWERPIVDTPKEGDIDWYFEEAHQAFGDVKTAVSKLAVLNEETLYETATDLQNRAKRAIMPGIVAILASFVFSLVFNYFVNYYAVSPIVKITKGVKNFVNRKVPFNVQIESKDELSDLTSAIQTLCGLTRTSTTEREK